MKLIITLAVCTVLILCCVFVANASAPHGNVARVAAASPVCCDGRIPILLFAAALSAWGIKSMD